MLYKYLDYIWRCQLIDHEIKKFYFNGKPKLLFNTGLYRKNDLKIVYLLLIENDAYFKNKKADCPKWRVAFGSNSSESVPQSISCDLNPYLFIKSFFVTNDILREPSSDELLPNATRHF